jgi:multiple sugar transport system ATP-binding protein
VAAVSFSGVSKIYPDGTRAVSSINLEAHDGELLVLVGPSGCGKTTALRMVAGLEEVTEGEIRIGERIVNWVPAKDRDIAMVFQSYALYPHLNVKSNIAFGLQVRGLDRKEIDRRVVEVARVLGLEDFLDKKPRHLSGGQRQRVAMGRAIVREPAAFLMDEPLSNLDAKLRVQMRAEVSRLQRGLLVTTIYVTHDQVEAMTMGDRVAVMRKGELLQVASPQELYDHPVNLFVGGFIGSPAMNMLEAVLERSNGELRAAIGGQRITLDSELLAKRPGVRGFEGRKVIVGIRPEDLEDAELAPDAPADRRLRGRVELREALGSEVLAHVTIEARQALTEDVRELAADIEGGAPSPELEDSPGRGEARIVGSLGPRSRVREDQPAEIAVDTRNLHFFDPETSLGIYDGGEPDQGGSRDEDP